MKKTNIYFIPIFVFVFSSMSFAQSTSCITLTKDLYVGLSDSSTQGEVSILQNFLKTKGYATSLSVTGFFGAGTQVAVQTFQSRSNIVSSGSPSSTGYGAVGASTRLKIKNISCGYITTTTGSLSSPSSYSSSPSQNSSGLTIGSRGAEVTKLQEFLISNGYASLIPAGATGYFGGQTRAALAAFQSANGISPAMGYFGPITRAKVASMSGVSVPAIPCSNGVLFSTLTGLSCTASPIPPVLPITPIPPVTPTPPTNLPSLPKCNDNLDNDSDGKIDYPNDPGCASLTDNNENDSLSQCADGIDNDGDAVIDYPYEPGCSSQTDSSESNDPLLLLQNNYDNSLWNIGYSLGGQKTYLVGGDFGDQTTGTVDLERLRRIIEGNLGYPAIPTSFNGYAVLDIEVPYMDWLRESASSQHFQYAQSEMLKALNFAKQLRPNAKWGYYDIPFFTIHFPGGSWADADAGAISAELAKVFAPTALLNAVDFYAPSIYSPYPNASTPTYMLNKELARNRESVKQSVIRSNGKPVFTYISDRFWNSNPVYNYMAMPYQEFIEKQFIGMDYGADGVFLWGGDNYWYDLGYVFDPATLPAYALVSRAQIRAAWDQELPFGIDPHTYINAFQEQTLRITAQELFGTNYAPIWPLFNDVGGTPEDGSKVDEPVAFLPNTLQQFAAVFMAVLRFLGF